MRAYAVVKRSQRLIGETDLRRGVVVFCSPCLGIREKKGLGGAWVWNRKSYMVPRARPDRMGVAPPGEINGGPRAGCHE